MTVLYPNRFSRGALLPAGATTRVPEGTEFRMVARAPFGREVLKALVTPSPLIERRRGRAVMAALDHDPGRGAAAADAGTDLGGLDRALWATGLARRHHGPHPGHGRPAGPSAPAAGGLPSRRRRWPPGEIATASSRAGRPRSRRGRSSSPAAEPAHDRSLVVVYRPTTGMRSFGRSGGGGGLFGRVRYVDPERDGADASGTRSLHRSFGDLVRGRARRAQRRPRRAGGRPQLPGPVARAGARRPSLRRPSADGGDTPAYWDAQWGLHNPFFRTPAERLDVAWRAALERYRAPDRPVVVAVLDTGVRFDNPHLGPILWRNDLEIAENGIDDDGNGFVDDVRGWDAVDGDGDPTDPSADESHGTFVASQIGGVGGAIQAMAPDVRILPVRVLDGQGRGSLRQLIEGVRYAAQSGARVVNLSFGMRPMAAADPRLDRVFEALVRRGRPPGRPAGDRGRQPRRRRADLGDVPSPRPRARTRSRRRRSR